MRRIKREHGIIQILSQMRFKNTKPSKGYSFDNIQIFGRKLH